MPYITPLSSPPYTLYPIPSFLFPLSYSLFPLHPIPSSLYPILILFIVRFNFHLPLFLSLLSASAFASAPQTGSGETDGYKLVWQDLFDADNLDPLRWNIEVNGTGGGNNELQYYTDRPENIRLGDDGNGNHCLIITARRENYRNKSFTSGRLNTMNFVTFTHGKIEASIKLPVTANGLWPAFWMMGNDWQDVGWPKCGETDILEMGHSDGIRNGTSDRYFNGAAHWGQSWPQASHAQSSTRSYSLQDGEFHLYTLIWDENEFRMYVDLDRQPLQTPYYRMTIPASDNQEAPGYYFHKDNFIIFNLAIGGNFPGIHDASGITALNESNSQQASMYVNYVKVYQRPDDKSATLFCAVPSDEADQSGISAVNAADFYISPSLSADAEIEVFDLGGTRICSMAAAQPDVFDTLTPGFYILRQGDKAVKILK